MSDDPTLDDPATPRTPWVAPGRGSWDLDTVHATGVVPAVLEELLPSAVRAGFRATTARYGLPISHVEVAFVNHRQYSRMVAVAEPFTKWGERAAPPPRPVLWFVSRVHPELRRRAGAADEAFRTRRWRADITAWHHRTAPARTRANLALQDEAVASLTADALAGHVRRAAANASAGITEHFDLVGPGTIPVGQLLVAAEGWKLDPAAVLALLRGSSPASAEPTRLLDAIAAALVEAGAQPASLDEIGGVSAEADAALDVYLRLHGWRLVTAYEPSGRALVELPDVILSAIAAAVDRATRTDPGGPATHEDGDRDGRDRDGRVGRDVHDDTAAIRANVPAADRGRFDALLAEARLAYGLRDDNVGITFMWTLGLVRRSLLEAAARLTAAGVLGAATDVMTLRTAEIAALLTGRGGPGPTEIAERARFRAAVTAAASPAHLGPPAPPPPDLTAFPAPMVRAIRAFVAYYRYEGADGGEEAPISDDEDGERGELSGVGIGDHPHRGRARVARSPETALGTVEPGDVLVTMTTTPAFNAVLSVAGALVVEQGGLLSHAALVARELGIPAVIGAAGALETIPDGSDVEVDPVAGLVRVLP